MTRYEYDLFISFHDEIRSNVDYFLSEYQRKGRWRVFLADCNFEISNAEKLTIMQKSKIFVGLSSESYESSPACKSHFLGFLSLRKPEVNQQVFRKRLDVSSLFKEIKTKLRKLDDEEQIGFNAEKNERREKIGFLEIEVLYPFKPKYDDLIYRINASNFLYGHQQVKCNKINFNNGFYKGEINAEGLRHGLGTMDYSNQEVYTGEWKANKRHGMGIYQYKNNIRYEGEWVEDIKEGICITRYPNSKYMYRGYMKNGEQSGKGVFWYPGNKLYAGDWDRNKRNGLGVYWVSASNELYDGEWVNDKKHGKGVSIFANGEKYEGDWYEDLMQGRGTFWFLNGDRFEGAWDKGKKIGAGVLFSANGEVFDCEFEDDRELRREKRSSHDGNGDCCKEDQIKVESEVERVMNKMNL